MVKDGMFKQFLVILKTEPKYFSDSSERVKTLHRL